MSGKCRYAGAVPEGLDGPKDKREGLEPGWLFLLAGLAILASAVLLPAIDDTNAVRWERDRAIAIESHRQARIDRYGQYLSALDRSEPDLMEQLAAGQLNLIPRGRALLQTSQAAEIDGWERRGQGGASQARMVFAALEPEPLALSERVRTGSVLEQWTLDERARPWVIALGGLCALVGLMPATQAIARQRISPGATRASNAL